MAVYASYWITGVLVQPALKSVDSITTAFVFIFLFGGPLGEEIGWRGYAFPRLLEKRSFLSASLLLGVGWGVWHLPLFAFNTLHTGIPIGLYLIQVLGASILIGYVYKRTNGSLFLAMLMHSGINVSGIVFPIMQDYSLSKLPYVIMLVILWSVDCVLLKQETVKGKADALEKAC